MSETPIRHALRTLALGLLLGCLLYLAYVAIGLLP